MVLKGPMKKPPVPLTPAVFHILLALADGPLHGYGIMQAVEATAGERAADGPGHDLRIAAAHGGSRAGQGAARAHRRSAPRVHAVAGRPARAARRKRNGWRASPRWSARNG